MLRNKWQNSYETPTIQFILYQQIYVEYTVLDTK